MPKKMQNIFLILIKKTVSMAPTNKKRNLSSFSKDRKLRKFSRAIQQICEKGIQGIVNSKFEPFSFQSIATHCIFQQFYMKLTTLIKISKSWKNHVSI